MTRYARQISKRCRLMQKLKMEITKMLRRNMKRLFRYSTNTIASMGKLSAIIRLVSFSTLRLLISLRRVMRTRSMSRPRKS